MAVVSAGERRGNFGASAPYPVGVEEKLFVVERDGAAIACRTDELVGRADGRRRIGLPRAFRDRHDFVTAVDDLCRAAEIDGLTPSARRSTSRRGMRRASAAPTPSTRWSASASRATERRASSARTPPAACPPCSGSCAPRPAG